MNQRVDTGSLNGFILGVITGGFIGAALTVAFAPKVAAQVRQRVRASAADLREVAARSYEDTSTRIADAIDGIAARGESLRNDAADAVASGARQVERLATASKVSGPRRA
jgi:gas vesicle protein